MSDTPQKPTKANLLAALKRELVFIELKDSVRQELGLPALVPMLKSDLDKEMANGEIPASAFTAAIEALKLLQPDLKEYDRFLARYYLLEGERAMQQDPPDDYQAQRYFEKSAELEQAELSAEAAFYLAALLSPDDEEKAIDHYQLSIELNPQAAAPHFELARLLRERRDLSGALAEFEAAFRLEPNNASLLNEVGDTHLMADDLLKAQAAFRRAAELEPDYWVLPVKLGIVDYNLEDFPAAIRNLRRGLDESPNELDEGYDQFLYVEGLYYLALAFRDTGRPEQSRKLIRAALQINPEHEGALTFEF